MDTKADIIREAEKFIQTCYREIGKADAEAQVRITAIKREVDITGTYIHTFEELEHGARMAWRNNNHCIGRLFWKTLHVRDQRELESTESVFTSLLEHIQFATNGGKIRPTISIYRAQVNKEAGPRIWNHQLIRYAGYVKDGKTIGDPASVAFTEECMRLGWQGAGTAYDILPLVIQMPGQLPQLFEIPAAYVLEVAIQHPSIKDFQKLAAKWYAVPIISDMRLEIGGIDYTAAPFNGWYMGTEIGARNLADEDRYNLLPAVAEIMGLDTETHRSLWQDEALVQLNIAVLDSFYQKGVTIVDHHTAATQFQLFEKKEQESERELTGNWTWLIPPLSPATTHIFHKPYQNEKYVPNYFYQSVPY